MANAKKCDRCGKYYEKNEEHSFIHSGKIIGIVKKVSADETTSISYDLCDSCITDFGLFMDGLKIEDEDACKYTNEGPGKDAGKDTGKDAGSEQVGTNVKRTNMTVGQLKNVLSLLPNHMDVIIPAIDPLDANKFDGFRHVRTAGVLSCVHERDEALCLNSSADGLDISGQIRYNKLSHTTCERVMF